MKIMGYPEMKVKKRRLLSYGIQPGSQTFRSPSIDKNPLSFPFNYRDSLNLIP